jgi:hypothetical protein
MTTAENNTIRLLKSSGQFIDATFVQHAKNYPVAGQSIIVNPNPTSAYVAGLSRKFVPAFSSTILVDTRIEEAESLLFFRVVEPEGIADIVREPGWRLFGDLLPGDAESTVRRPFPRDTPLWRGPQDDLDLVKFDPALALGETSSTGATRTFRVKINLWFAPAGTDCFIHNQHDFLETHAQIHGLGRMQKFTTPKHETLYEDELMSPGCTHAPFCRTDPTGGFVYPWHQYRADSDCVWLAVEYHAEQA